MERETILYYYPMPQQASEMNNRYAAKRHWFQDAVLQTERIADQEEFCILGCAVPPFYYRHKPWKAGMLSEIMETVLGDAAGMTDTYVHPQIQMLLTEEYFARWMPREETIRMLVKYLLKQHAGKAFGRSGAVTVLLGSPDDMDRQMEMTWELLQPYLPRVNKMLVCYERLEAWQDSWEWEYLERYYYEYGLVPQLEPYRRTRMIGEEGQIRPADGESGHKEEAISVQRDVPKTVLRCGKEQCRGIILDYCSQFRYPRIMPGCGVYIDVLSGMEKERICKRKGMPLPYTSPLKYLDTMVKNSYDRKVKMT